MYPVKFGKQEELGRAVDYVLQKVRFECKDDGYYMLAETFFDGDGSSIPDKRRIRSYGTISPNTTLSSIKFAVCLDLALQ